MKEVGSEKYNTAYLITVCTPQRAARSKVVQCHQVREADGAHIPCMHSVVD